MTATTEALKQWEHQPLSTTSLDQRVRFYGDALAGYQHALEIKRAAEEVERDAKETYETAFGESAFELGGMFQVQGNKIYLVGEEYRQVTAAQRDDWIDRGAKAACATQHDTYKAAHRDRVRADDDVDLWDRQLTAAKWFLQAAIAEHNRHTAAHPTSNGA